MAGRRGSDDASDIPNGDSLEALGRRIDAGAPAASNEDALRTLGERIDGTTTTRAARRRTRRGRAKRGRRRPRAWKIALVSTASVLVLAVGLAAGAYYYAYTKYERLVKPLCGTTHKVCDPEIPGKPFNVLVIGSDSRAGLTGAVARETGAGSVSGQRSDVVRVFHVDPSTGSVSVVSIPRDTMVTLLANQSLYGDANRINVNYANGPALLVRTIEDNFGIPINHIVQVSFGGLIGAVNALGGVYMNFPYPALDNYSSLDMPRTGCQRLDGVQALAVARSRHFQYYEDGTWQYDGTSDFGRIDRQDQFMRALIDRARSQATNLSAINGFLTSIPEGIQIDNTFGFNELLGLALKFHNFNPDALAAYTLPTYGAVSPSLGDVLYVDQPAAQQLLVKVFGQVGTLGGLSEPTDPPPTPYGTTPEPPVVSSSTAQLTSSSGSTPPAGHHVTTTTAPLHTEPYYTFNPTACTPR